MKILIISNNSLSDTQSNGKTMASFFRTLPREDVAQLYFGTNEKPDLTVCSSYYRITEIDIIKSIINFSFKTSNTHSKLLLKNKDSIKSESSLISWLKKRNKTLLFVRDLLWKCKSWDTKELNDWIKEFNPNVIFSLLGNCIFVHNIVLTLSQRYNVPYVVHFTDDYVINDRCKNLFQYFHYKELCSVYKLSISKSSKCYAIGDKMSHDYSIKYNKDFGVLVNSVDFKKFENIKAKYLDLNEEIVISFIGGVHLNRWKSIVQLGSIIEQLNSDYNIRIIIKVFTVIKPDANILHSLSTPPIEYCGGLTYEGVLEQINNSHFLLHVESFDEVNRTYTKYSISTKIPEYLASRRGIIAYGPHEVASMCILSENNFGCCLTDLDNIQDIKKKILNAIKTYNKYDYQAQYDYAYNNFNQQIVSSKLINDLNQISNVSI